MNLWSKPQGSTNISKQHIMGYQSVTKRIAISIIYLPVIIICSYTGCETKEQKFAKEQAKQVIIQKNKQIEYEQKIRNEIGDELLVRIGNDYTLKFIKNIKSYININKGIITITFDVNNIDFIINNDFHPEYPPSIFTLFNKLLIKLFDSNRQYITHFTTKEYFVFSNYINKINAVYKLYPTDGNKLDSLPHFVIKPVNNVIQYQINQRDAAYIKYIEISFQGNPYQFVSRIN